MVWTLYQKMVMLSAASLATEQHFCASASWQGLAAVIRGSLAEGEARAAITLLWWIGFSATHGKVLTNKSHSSQELLISWNHHLLSVPQVSVLR